MPSSQNWTFCRAFSPLDVAHVLTAGRPVLRAGKGPARRRWTRHRLMVGATLDSAPLPARSSGRWASPPIALPVGGPPSRVWGHERATAPPSSPPTSLWGLVRWTGQRAGRPCPTPFPPVTSRLPFVCALPRSDCAPLACVPRAALPRIGLGLRPRHRLRRQVGARAVLPDFVAHSLATVPQSVCMARACGAPRTSSPGPLRGCGFRACPCHTAVSPGVSARQGDELRKNGSKPAARPPRRSREREGARNLGTRSALEKTLWKSSTASKASAAR